MNASRRWTSQVNALSVLPLFHFETYISFKQNLYPVDNRWAIILFLALPCRCSVRPSVRPSALIDINWVFYSWVHLRNEFNFWDVHGIMNTSGLLQSKWSPKLLKSPQKQTNKQAKTHNRITSLNRSESAVTETKNSKWVWSGNTTITNRRQPCGTARKSRSTITRHHEDNLSKATSSLFPIKMIAILKRTQSNVQQNIEQLQTPTMGVTINKTSTTTEPPP